MIIIIIAIIIISKIKHCTVTCLYLRLWDIPPQKKKKKKKKKSFIIPCFYIVLITTVTISEN